MDGRMFNLNAWLNHVGVTCDYHYVDLLCHPSRSAAKWARLQRNSDAWHMRQSGATYNDIAKKLSISRSRAQQIVMYWQTHFAFPPNAILATRAPKK